ncbi:hypothetical protein MC885_020795, partial [Smutsia gigantea]
CPVGVEDPGQRTEKLGLGGAVPPRKAPPSSCTWEQDEPSQSPSLEGGAGGSGQRDSGCGPLRSGQPTPPLMGNSHCVPQTPRRLRASFSRKPSLKGTREDGTRKLTGLFGSEASPHQDSTANKIFYYVPGTDISGLESQREGLEQPFLSVFKTGQWRVPVRNLGKVVHYAKVKLRFQHSQDISDCYLELFPSHLYFQAHGSEGLTFQGLLPLVELSVCQLEGSREHAFQITGPLPAPLLVLCPSQAELGGWLYHLEKQMALVGARHCHTASPQDPLEDKLPGTLQHRLSRLHTVLGRPAVGSAICASRVKLQHLPSQEQWDRLLVLYPTSLAIFSEEADGLCFKVGPPHMDPPQGGVLCAEGELPLSAVHVNLEAEEKQVHSFLIEGRLINTIRVVCASYEDYSLWLLCLQAVSCRDGAPPLPGPEGFLEPRRPTQVMSGGRGSLSSDGRTSWDSGYLAPPSTHTSYSLPVSAAVFTKGCPAKPAHDQANPGCTSSSGPRAELRRGGSSRSPRSKAHGEGPGPATPLHLDLTKLSRLGLEGEPKAPDHSLEMPHSPLYVDPYTPPATSHHKITDVRGLDEFLSAVQSPLGPEPLSPLPSIPVSMPVSGLSGPHLLSEKGALQPQASRRHRDSSKGRGPWPPGSPQHTAIPPAATTTSGKRLHLPPTSGGPAEPLRLKWGSSSGSDSLPGWLRLGTSFNPGEVSAAGSGSFFVGPQADWSPPLSNTRSGPYPSRVGGGARTLTFPGLWRGREEGLNPECALPVLLGTQRTKPQPTFQGRNEGGDLMGASAGSARMAQV